MGTEVRNIDASTRLASPPVREREGLWPFSVSRDAVHSAIIELGRAGVFVCDRHYRIWEVDGTFLEMEGVSRVDVIGKTVAEILGGEIFSLRKTNIDRAFAGIASRLRTPGTREKSRGLVFEVFFCPVFDDDGDVACVVCTSRDVTQFDQLNERLSLHEEIVRQIADRIALVGRDFIYRFANAANAAFYGMTPNEMIGVHVRDLIGAERFEGRARARFERCFAGESVEYEYALSQTSGVDTYVRIRMDPYRDRTGQVTGALLVLRDVTAPTRLARELHRQAREDVLTGLSNRLWLQEELSNVLTRVDGTGVTAGLLTVDIDGFKLVNDLAGHIAGDALLCQIADMLRAFEASDGVRCARFGGDEFAVLVDNTDEQAAIALGERIVAMLDGMQFSWEGVGYRVSASIGIAIIEPRMAGDLPHTNIDVLHQADQACLHAKETGGGRAAVYRPDAVEMVARRADIGNIQLIRQSLEQGTLQLHTMPIDPIDGVSEPMREVLLRFVSGDGRILPPSSLIATAERHGMMQEIDRWVVSKALSHAVTLAPDERITINLSGLSVGDPDFKAFLLETLDGAPRAARQVSFEITETAAVRSMSTAQALVFALRERGCGVILDDFGSGLSSFAYLRQFPIDSLKIDGSIIGDVAHDELQRTIVAGIVAVARQIGVSVIAEYVEDLKTLEVLRDLGVTHAQGYHVGRPSRWV
jgi:diguanylate cyclase (GGDEF)-like protein/PAS domain S-box-containing protein